jgi:hypothetical protein
VSLRATLWHALHDAWQLSLAPGLPARLPWPRAWALWRHLAARPELYADAVAAAAVAAEYLPIADAAAFARDVRTTWLLDIADLHLSRRHGLDWWPNAVAVDGAWPREGAFVAVTFHYGTGLCICRSLRQAGHRSRFLSGRFEPHAFRGRPLLYRYGRRRLAEVERLGGAPVAYRPGVRQALLDTLARGVPVIGLIDVPPRLAPRGQHPVTLLGQPASLPDGLLVLARDAGVPIVPCWVEIDFATGRRRLVIGAARAPEPVASMLAALAADLDRLVRAQPAAWMFWQEWRDWLRDAPRVSAAGTFSNADAGGRLAPSNPATGSFA